MPAALTGRPFASQRHSLHVMFLQTSLEVLGSCAWGWAVSKLSGGLDRLNGTGTGEWAVDKESPALPTSVKAIPGPHGPCALPLSFKGNGVSTVSSMPGDPLASNQAKHHAEGRGFTLSESTGLHTPHP